MWNQYNLCTSDPFIFPSNVFVYNKSLKTETLLLSFLVLQNKIRRVVQREAQKDDHFRGDQLAIICRSPISIPESSGIFFQRLVAWRDSGIMEFISLTIS